MSTYVMQKEELAQAALKLREVLLSARKNFDQQNLHISVADVDYALKLLNPILDLCIAKQLEEPFYFTAYMGQIMGDHLAFPEIQDYWFHLCRLGRGGLTPEEFSKTDFVKYRLMPKQLRPPPEYVPSQADQEKISRDLMFKQR
jgi:hypothetical protein